MKYIIIYGIPLLIIVKYIINHSTKIKNKLPRKILKILNLILDITILGLWGIFIFIIYPKFELTRRYNLEYNNVFKYTYEFYSKGNKYYAGYFLLIRTIDTFLILFLMYGLNKINHRS